MHLETEFLPKWQSHDLDSLQWKICHCHLLWTWPPEKLILLLTPVIWCGELPLFWANFFLNVCTSWFLESLMVLLGCLIIFLCFWFMFSIWGTLNHIKAQLWLAFLFLGKLLSLPFFVLRESDHSPLASSQAFMAVKIQVELFFFWWLDGVMEHTTLHFWNSSKLSAFLEKDWSLSCSFPSPVPTYCLELHYKTPQKVLS